MERGIDVGATLWRKRWPVVLAGLVGGLLATLAAFLQTPQYAASARVLVKPTTLNPPGSVPLPASISMPTEIEIATSGAVLDRARRSVGTDLGTIAASAPPDSQILVVTATHENPRTAAAGANAVADAYLQFRSEQAMAAAQRAVEQAQRQIAGLQRRADELARELRRAPRATTEIVNEIEQINGQIALWRAGASQYNLAALDPGTVLARASPPSAPSRPNRPASAVRGFVAGLLVGVAFVLTQAAGRAARERAST